MTDRQFVDTNVLVYSRDTTEPEKHATAQQIMKQLWNDRTGIISTQVCNEYYVTVTRKLVPGLPQDLAWDDVEALFAWDPVPVDAECMRVAQHVQVRYQLSWWDSLIVAAASQSGCTTILSEELNAQQEYLGMLVLNPFG